MNRSGQQNDTQSLKWHKKGVVLFFEVFRHISKLPGPKIDDFDPNWAFTDCNSSLNSEMAKKWCTKLEVAQNSCPIIFRGHPSHFNFTRAEKQWFDSNLSVSGWQLQFEFMDVYEMTQIASGNMKDVPYCFSRLSVKFWGHMDWKIDSHHIRDSHRAIKFHRLLFPIQAQFYNLRAITHIHNCINSIFISFNETWLEVLYNKVYVANMSCRSQVGPCWPHEPCF